MDGGLTGDGDVCVMPMMMGGRCARCVAVRDWSSRAREARRALIKLTIPHRRQHGVSWMARFAGAGWMGGRFEHVNRGPSRARRFGVAPPVGHVK